MCDVHGCGALQAPTRRRLLGAGAALASLWLGAPLAAKEALPERGLSPQQALAVLQQGNSRYVSGRSTARDLVAARAQHPLGQRPRGAGALSAQTQFCPLAPANTARLHSPRPAPGCTGPADPVVYARRGNGHLQQPAAQPEPAAAPASTALPGGLHWRATVTRNAPSGHGNDPARNAGAHHGAGRQPLVSHGAPHHHGSGHRGQLAQPGQHHGCTSLLTFLVLIWRFLSL